MKQISISGAVAAGKTTLLKALMERLGAFSRGFFGPRN